MKHTSINGNDLLKEGDEHALRQCLERGAPDGFGGPSAIVDLQCSRFLLNTSYDAYLVSLRLATGGEDRLRACAFLVDHGAGFFWSTVERAFRSVAQVAPHLVGRLENLVRGYAPVV